MATLSVSSSSTSSASGSPRRSADPSIAEVNAIATDRLSSPSSHTPTRLSGDESPKDPEVEKYNQACQLLKEGKAEQARSLFLELIDVLDQDESHLIDSADCNIGVACSYPEDSAERKDFATKAKTLLDDALVHTLKGDPSDKDRISTFQKMEALYEEVSHLVPSDETAFHDDVRAKIKKCSRLVIANFYDTIKQARVLLSKDQPDQAREIVLAVMPNLKSNKAEFILARAQGNTWLATAFPPNKPSSRKHHLILAQFEAIAAYDRKEELLQNRDPVRVYDALVLLFNSLSRLNPDNAQIKENLVACKRMEASFKDGKDPLIEKYKQACQLLKERHYEQARSLFLELINTFGQDESHLTDSAACRLGVAHSHLKGSAERKDFALQAKKLLDDAFVNALDDDVSDEATIDSFNVIRNLYGEVSLLVPADETAVHDDVKDKIEECSRRIPALTTFYDKLQEAQDLFNRGVFDKAREILLAVMPTILDSDDVEFLLARSAGNMLIASTLPSGETRLQKSLEAQTQAFEAYDRKEELLRISQPTKVYDTFIHLFADLSILIPDNAEIKNKLAECKKLHRSSVIRPFKEADGKGIKVTKDPVGDYWKPLRLFIAFGFATAVIVGAALLGRRLITKLN